MKQFSLDNSSNAAALRSPKCQGRVVGGGAAGVMLPWRNLLSGKSAGTPDEAWTELRRIRPVVVSGTEHHRDVHALDYPYGGLVVEVIDSPDADTRERVLE